MIIKQFSLICCTRHKSYLQLQYVNPNACIQVHMRKPYLLLGFVLVLSLILHDLCNSKDNMHVQALYSSQLHKSHYHKELVTIKKVNTHINSNYLRLLSLILRMLSIYCGMAYFVDINVNRLCACVTTHAHHSIQCILGGNSTNAWTDRSHVIPHDRMLVTKLTQFKSFKLY